MTPVSSRVSNCSLTAGEPRSDQKEQRYAVRERHNALKTRVPIGCPRNRSRNGLELVNPGWRSPFDVRTIRQKYRQLRTCNEEYLLDVGGVSGAEHTRYRARCASGRNRAAVAADFVNADFWGARRSPGRHSYYSRAGARPRELGGGERQESDDDLRHPWPRRSFLWDQYSSGAISTCPFHRAAGSDQGYAPTSIARVARDVLESALSRPDCQPACDRGRVDWKRH